MLKGDLIKPRLTTRGQQVWPQKLPADYRWLGVAGQLVGLFGRFNGRSRAALYDALRDFEGDSLDYPIIRGLAAVLEQRCTFGNEPVVDPVALREKLFGQGPVVVAEREGRVAETAVFYNITPHEAETALFADLLEEQILLDVGDPIAPADLITRYNLEVARGLLYWAKEMRLTVHDGYKDLFKYIKLFKLMHTITPLPTPDGTPPTGYQITLHGPISPFVHSTIRYGLQFARFMPALLLCQSWRMEADVRPPNARQFLRYALDDGTDLVSYFKQSGEFDSRLEADFAAEFAEKYGRADREWVLAREDELVLAGDRVMIPDFSLTNVKNGRRALIEIIGFWHPTYLRRKLEQVRAANLSNLILLVYESANVAADLFAESAGEVLLFKNKPVLKDVLAAVERAAY